MDEIQRFNELKEKLNRALESKIRLEERYKSEQKKLEEIISSIKAKGYDPTKLAEIKVAKEAELRSILDGIETEVNGIIEKLKSIEGSTNV